MKLSFLIAGALSFLALTSCCGGSGCESNTSCDNKVYSTRNNRNEAQCSSEEKTGIEKALNAYIEAAIKGDSRIAMTGFSPMATMSYVDRDSLVSVPIQALYDYYDITGPHNASYKISECNVADNIAMVRIESKFGDNEFTDMFTLVKDGDDWKIVSKVYHVKE